MLRKDQVTSTIGVVRKIIVERRKTTRSDYNLIVRNLNLDILPIDEADKIKVELDDYIENKLNYFYRRNNKDKIEEYKKVKFLWNKIFEFFFYFHHLVTDAPIKAHRPNTTRSLHLSEGCGLENLLTGQASTLQRIR